MQTLARVNRTFRGKDAGLLVAYAPLVENLAARPGRVHRSPTSSERPIGRDVGEAVELARDAGRRSCARWSSGYDWRAKLGDAARLGGGRPSG